MKIVTIDLISLIILLLARACINIALEPIVTYDEALSIDLRTKDCTITVTKPEEVSNIVSSAQQGDVICLLPGLFYPALSLTENPARANTTDYIIIRVNDVSVLPPPGIRISNAYESVLPKIDGRSAIEGNVHHIAFLGIDFYAQVANAFNMELRPINATNAPHHIIIDQCLFRSSVLLVSTTFFSGQYIALLNSHITAAASVATYIAGGSVIKIQNNYYDFEDVFLDILSSVVTNSDIEIRYNRFEKRGPTINYFGFVLSLYERVLIENNFIAPSNLDLNIYSDLMLFMNDIGSCYQRDFIFRNNWVENFVRGFIIYPSTNWTGSVATEYSIQDNFLKEGSHILPYTSGTAINFTQNTVLNGRGAFFAFIDPTDLNNVSLNFERNIIEAGEYGLGTTNFIPIVDLIGPQNWNWQDNLVITSTYRRTFPNNTLLEYNMTDVGFVDMENDNYNLLPSSKYSAENYGVQLGVDICKLINTAKLNIVVPGCPLDSVNLQPNEVIEITTDVTINGNLTMYPNSTLQVPFDDGKLNVSNCADFAGILSLVNTANVENGTEIIIAYYGCYGGGEFDEISLVDESEDPCLSKYVKLTYAPTSLSATITIVNTCNNNNNNTQQLPDWAIAVIVIGICLVLVVIFIVISVTVPAVRQKVFPFAPRRK